MPDITVACVLRSGGIYTPEWVDRLQRGVAGHLSLPHRFVCLSDMDVACTRIPLRSSWPGWWAKIELFQPGLFRGTVLYLDLDVIVTGSLDTIASHEHTFTMAHDYYRPHHKCSTAMAWRGEDKHGIYERFESAPALFQRSYRWKQGRGILGDQAFIEDVLTRRGVPIDTFSELFGERSVASYKVHRCHSKPPAEAAVVVFHGKPKPHTITEGWVAEAWSRS